MAKKLPWRPRKLTAEQQLEVFEAFQQYIKDEEDPTLVGFIAWNETAIGYDVTRDDINNWDEFKPLIKRGINKQEAYLVKTAGQNKYNPTIAIFRLKQPQHGWRDQTFVDSKEEVTHKYEELDDEQLEAVIKARKDRAA